MALRRRAGRQRLLAAHFMRAPPPVMLRLGFCFSLFGTATGLEPRLATRLFFFEFLEFFERRAALLSFASRRLMMRLGMRRRLAARRCFAVRRALLRPLRRGFDVLFLLLEPAAVRGVAEAVFFASAFLVLR